MEQINETPIKIKICKTCGLDNNTTKFPKTRSTRQCIKCNSSQYRKKEYFKQYYIDHKDLMCERASENYFKNKLIV
jgi:hypothetical protein